MESFEKAPVKDIKEFSEDNFFGDKMPSLGELNKPIDLSTSPGRLSLEAQLSGFNEPVDVYIKVEMTRLPLTGGEWSGEIGNSEWIPDNEIVPKQPPGNEKTWGEIKNEYGIESIPFSEGEPDFSAVSEATVEIEEFTTDRNMNFAQADEACAAKWTEENKDGRSWTAADVKEYRKENQLSWHERSDQTTMDLVPQVVHGNVPHSGGISAAKKGES